MRKLLLFVLLFFYFFSVEANEDYLKISCPYYTEYEICLDNQDMIRTVTDFTCIEASNEYILYQIILDKKFEEIDTKIENWLKMLHDQKSYYFGPEKQQNYTSGIDDITSFLGEDYGEYEKEYARLCSYTSTGSIINELINCVSDPITTFNNANGFLGQSSDCVNLYKTKLFFYRELAYNIMKENKQKIAKDSHKLFTQQQRIKYDELLDMLMINIGYIERIWMKWPTKTKNIH